LLKLEPQAVVVVRVVVVMSWSNV